MAQPRLVIIDDDHGQPIGREVPVILERESPYRVSLIEGPLSEGTKVMDLRADLIIPVLPASKERAVQLLATLRAKDAETPFLPVFSASDLNEIPNELSLPTNDFLVAPLRVPEVLARVRRLLLCSGCSMRPEVCERMVETGLTQLVGEDPAVVAVKRAIPMVARSETPVLLSGESGTGKELCARALHYLSPRAKEPFLPVNCGAIPVELFESELFGHQKGAFTGAWAAQTGLIEEAEGGTLFLDEIESLGLGAQVKLLRFLEDCSYHPLGSPKLRQADVRIIAATNRDLLHMIREGTFREDLFYRLAVIVLRLPPLRQRRGDIPLLVAHFWEKYGDRPGGVPRNLSSRAMEALCQYGWPGNIRELENVIQQIVVFSDVQFIEHENLPIPVPAPPAVSTAVSFTRARAQVIEQFEKSYITELLRAKHGNVTHAAKEAQKERRAFGRLIKKYQLEKR